MDHKKLVDEQVLRALVDTSGNLLLHVGREGTINFANKACFEILKRYPEDLTGHNLSEIIHVSETDFVLPLTDDSLFRLDKKNDQIIEFQDRDGGRIPLKVSWENYTDVPDITGYILYAQDLNYQNMLEQEQKYSRDIFAAAFRVNTALCAISDPVTGEMIDVNDVWLNTLGYTREEAIGKTSLELGSWGDEENRARMIDTLREMGRLDGYEINMLTKDHETRIVKVTAVILKIGSYERLFSSASDITEQRQLELEQKYNQELLEASFRVNTSMTSITDPLTGLILDVNETWIKTLGFTRDEVVGKSTVGLKIWESADSRNEMISLLDENGRVDDFETNFYTKSREVRLVQVSAVVLKIGLHERLFASSNDITEERRKARELKQSEERFRDIAEYASDWFWELDEDYCFTFVSDGAQPTEDFDFKRIMGKCAFDYFKDTGTVSDDMIVKRRLMSQLPFKNYKQEFTSKDGDISYHLYSGKPLFDDKEKFLGYRGTGTNVTKEVLAEQKRISAEELLNQAQKMETVGQLTGGIAHDFNNLLSIIIGNADMIEEVEGVQKQVKTIIRAATRGAELTQSLLAFSRKQVLKPKVMKLDEQLVTMLAMLPRTLGESVIINTRSDAHLWSCFADPGQVENVLLNLAINARDAMPGGGYLNVVFANKTLNDGDFVSLSVIDTGEGMSEQILEHVLEPFFTTKEVGRGSGLGLSMVYGFADQSNGHLFITSEVGEGTCVELCLPRDTDPELSRFLQ